MPLVSIRAPASGIWRADVGSLTVGDTAVDVRQAIGGETSADAALTLRRRPPPPAILVVQAPQTIHTLSVGPELTGTGAAGADVLVTANGAEVDTITVGFDGAWSIDLSVLGGGWWDLALVQKTSLGDFPAVRRVLSVQPYAASTAAVLARWSVLGASPSKTRADWLDLMVMRPLEAARLIDKADAIWLPGLAHAELAARVNLANPAAYELSPSAPPPGWTAADGYDADGSTTYLAANITIATDFSGTKFKKDSAHLWARVRDIFAPTAPLIGQSSGTTTINLRRSSTGVLQGFVNSTGSDFGSAPASGLFITSRIGATHVKASVDGVMRTEQAAASTAPAGARSLRLMISGGTFADGFVEGAGVGAGYDDGDHAALASILSAAFAAPPPA